MFFFNVSYYSNILGGKTTRIVERMSKANDDQKTTYAPLLRGPETVLFDDDGVMYILSEEAKLVKLSKFLPLHADDKTTMTAQTSLVADLGMGRPLGGKFVANDDGLTSTLYVADSLLGLVRVKNIPRMKKVEQDAFSNGPTESPRPLVEIIASRVQLKDGTWSQLLFADDVDIGPKTGHVYFSDGTFNFRLFFSVSSTNPLSFLVYLVFENKQATDVAPDRIGTRMWDTLGASIVDFARGKKVGRLLRYKPETDEIDILVDSGIHFANGVAVDKNETYLIVSDAFGIRILKYHLQGPKKGQLEVMVEPLVGLPDGGDCSFATGKCYAAITSSKPPFLKFLEKMPPKVNQVFRTITLMLPKSMSPQPVPFGAFVEMDPVSGRVTRVVQDPTGNDLKFITGVTEHQGKLYLGSLNNDMIGVYDLS
jgi:hypothetical protein